jgi:hypothetical protein
MEPKRVWKPVIVWKEDVSHRAKKGDKDDKKDEDKKATFIGFILYMGMKYGDPMTGKYRFVCLQGTIGYLN